MSATATADFSGMETFTVGTEDRFQALQKELAGVATDSPAFYEDFQFIRREQKDPTYINNYARFVQWQPYTPAYLERAEEVVQVMVAELLLAMQLDGNKLAYVESPIVMSRMLERQGIWNYVARGALNINFPTGSGFEPFNVWSIDAKNLSRRRQECMWVVAPPFYVIDLSIQTYNYPHPVSHLLPRMVLEKDVKHTEADPAELLSPEAIEETLAAGLSLEQGLDELAPQHRSRFAPDFPAITFTKEETQFKYVPTGIVTTEDELETMKDFVSKGRSAMQIYDEEIKPRLRKV